MICNFQGSWDWWVECISEQISSRAGSSTWCSRWKVSDRKHHLYAICDTYSCKIFLVSIFLNERLQICPIVTLIYHTSYKFLLVLYRAFLVHLYLTPFLIFNKIFFFYLKNISSTSLFVCITNIKNDFFLIIFMLLF